MFLFLHPLDLAGPGMLSISSQEANQPDRLEEPYTEQSYPGFPEKSNNFYGEK
jgi:hypothetical protein